MPEGQLPLLIFPVRARGERNNMGGGGGRIHVPDIARQRERIAPQLAVLQGAFEARRLQLQDAGPLENPELVLVLEVVGTIQHFARAVAGIQGLEWLYEFAQDRISPDDDFHEQDRQDKLLTGRLYLLGTNQQALNQLLALWDRYQRNPAAPFDTGLAPFKHLFSHLRAIRPWSTEDRVGVDIRDYWLSEIESGKPIIRFEIEIWYHASAARNDAARAEIATLIEQQGGDVISHAVIDGIAYHGLLVDLPIEAVRAILEGGVPQLLLSDRIMFFRPRGQSVTESAREEHVVQGQAHAAASDAPPIVGLLDGLPMANHALLAGRLTIDDPDGWEAGYEAKDRVHGTAMASLILHGDLDEAGPTLHRRLYVRPVMRPDPDDGYHRRRRESTPNDVLLIDLMHRAVRRMFEGEGNTGPVAPTVKIINLSLGDPHRIFANEMSPWARLIDWLSYQYSVLFIVSAGNDPSDVTLATPRDSLVNMSPPERTAMALSALVQDGISRRLMAPAESMNALTVGALHMDASNPNVPQNRFDLFEYGGISPISRVGLGYRRAVKPDILMSGGRCLYQEQLVGQPDVTILRVLDAGYAPGHKVAISPDGGGDLNLSTYTRGTSNAAALATRAAAQAYDMLEELRAQEPNAPGHEYDAVVLKALLVHGASWGELSDNLLRPRPDLAAIPNGITRHHAQKDFLTTWLGYGPANIERAIGCTQQRATLLGVGTLAADKAMEFSAPLPTSLAGRVVWRRVTVTLAWLTPTHPTHQAYRRAKLWASGVGAELRVNRTNSVSDKAALRGTVQHEVFEGADAVVFVEGDAFACKVNCARDAGSWQGGVRFAICVSLEVAVDSGIAVYEEIRERLAPPVPIQPG
ncbi:S8 family peptidase [Dyella acidisoli]|uniref:Peptidase S8/S53 domain-containing protein n=1 Tax=Dyella acidisoli TaxID=1867834 RepID=A0ABQ5XLA1_9GAMM|nr:S8 family peptidase [Dyella acidisoli]GLQ91974.1 hypothetical protein GCM10007901_09250 [Dyella acidisoli]